MEIIEPRRLYQQLAAELKTRIEQKITGWSLGRFVLTDIC